jgi:hypothetical protein
MTWEPNHLHNFICSPDFCPLADEMGISNIYEFRIDFLQNVPTLRYSDLAIYLEKDGHSEQLVQKVYFAFGEWLYRKGYMVTS